MRLWLQRVLAVWLVSLGAALTFFPYNDTRSGRITLDGMAGKEFIPWESLERVELSDEYIPVGRVGVTMPKKLQRRLKLKDLSGGSLMVNEPRLSSVKQEIIRGFDDHAPDALRQEILERLSEW